MTTTSEEHVVMLAYAERVQGKAWATSAEQRLARWALALAAENQALENRCARLELVIDGKSELPCPACGCEERASDGTYVCECTCPVTTQLIRERSKNQALEERVLALRIAVNHLGCTSEPIQSRYYYALGALKADEQPLPSGKEMADAMQRAADGRASRRRAYVREKAPVLYHALIRNDPNWTNWDQHRAKAEEQAGLIFDETEQGE